MERMAVVQERNGQAQEKRTTKALLEGPEMRWSKNPRGWTCSTPSGGCYLVTERGECSCMDHVKTCAGTELRCKHVIALRFKLAEQAPAPVQAPKPAGWDAMTLQAQDDAFDRIFGKG